MSAQGAAEDSAPTKHSVRVEWFQRDPTGGTLFISPTYDGNIALAHSGEENAVEAVTQR
jgi:hypothetical protein